MNNKGANLTKQSTRCVILTFVGSIFDESENLEAALEIAGKLVAE